MGVSHDLGSRRRQRSIEVDVELELSRLLDRTEAFACGAISERTDGIARRLARRRHIPDKEVREVEPMEVQFSVVPQVVIGVADCLRVSFIATDLQRDRSSD